MLRLLWIFCAVFFQPGHGSCQFPPEWTGQWYQKGAHPFIIEPNKIPSKGLCRDQKDDYFFFKDPKIQCHRCLVILARHRNVLQYRETFCDDDGDEVPTLSLVCSKLVVDNHLHTLIRVNGSPEPCPFTGSFTFRYILNLDKRIKECDHPVSYVDECASDSRLLFRFQRCDDVQDSENSEEELTCLANWKEGSLLYMVGMIHKMNSSLGRYYRCFTYSSNGDSFVVAESAGPTCEGLGQSYEGSSRVMNLTQHKSIPLLGITHSSSWSSSHNGAIGGDNKCSFPAALASSRHWTSLDGKTAVKIEEYTMTMGNDLHLTCARELFAEGNTSIYIAAAKMRCKTGFLCVGFHLRDAYIAEIQLGQLTGDQRKACAFPYNVNRTTPFITLFADAAETYDCPHLVETNGLKIQAVKVTLACGDATVVGCRSARTLQFLTTCSSSDRDLMTFRCHGKWEEDGNTYLIAGLEGSEAKYCLVYHTYQDVTQLSGLNDTCHRTTLPGITGNFTFNITAAGECEYLLSPASALLLPSVPIAVMLAAFQLLR